MTCHYFSLFCPCCCIKYCYCSFITFCSWNPEIASCARCTCINNPYFILRQTIPFICKCSIKSCFTTSRICQWINPICQFTPMLTLSWCQITCHKFVHICYITCFNIIYSCHIFSCSRCVGCISRINSAFFVDYWILRIITGVKRTRALCITLSCNKHHCKSCRYYFDIDLNSLNLHWLSWIISIYNFICSICFIGSNNNYFASSNSWCIKLIKWISFQAYNRSIFCICNCTFTYFVRCNWFILYTYHCVSRTNQFIKIYMIIILNLNIMCWGNFHLSSIFFTLCFLSINSTYPCHYCHHYTQQ